jgi:hypothetical protein
MLSAPELPVSITPSTTSTSTLPIVVDNWGQLFDQPAHSLEEDLESAELIRIDSSLTSTNPDMPTVSVSILHADTGEKLVPYGPVDTKYISASEEEVEVDEDDDST